MNQEKIGKFIKELRAKKEMTQQELAEKIGVTDRAISKWENGRGTPDISLLIPLANELDISVLELLNGEKTENQNNAIIDLIKQENKKIKIWKRLFMSITNMILIFMMTVTIFGYFVPMIYESSNSKGITRVVSESMKPTLESGIGIIYNKVNIEEVEKDDIVVYYYMNEEGQLLADGYVVHRVIDIINDDKGNVNLITKGDNNIEKDKQYVTAKNFVGVYNHKVSRLTTYFLEQNVQEYPSVLIFFTVSIIGILCLDIYQTKKYFLNRV